MEAKIENNIKNILLHFCSLAIPRRTMKSYGRGLLLFSIIMVELCTTARITNGPDIEELIDKSRDRQSHWCKGIAFNQTVSRKNCKDRHIKNKMCYGECFSYYFPGGGEGNVACFTCRPSHQEKKAVLLDCFESDRQNIQVVFIYIIKECSCMLIDMTNSHVQNGPP